MSKETFIDGNKTLIDTDYYLHLLQIENNWNKLKEHLKKQTIDLEIKREDISADAYIDRKMFLKEVLSLDEIETEEKGD